MAIPARLSKHAGTCGIHGQPDTPTVLDLPVPTKNRRT